MTLDWETAPEGPLFKMLAKEYRFDEWKGKTDEPYPAPLRGWLPPSLAYNFILFTNLNCSQLAQLSPMQISAICDL